MTAEAETDTFAELNDKAAVIDALLRHDAGFDCCDHGDHCDAGLFASALTDDVVVDLTAAVAKIWPEFPVLALRQEAVMGALIGSVGPLDPRHSIIVTNVHIELGADTAQLRCCTQAQLYLPGQGSNPSATAHALVMNRYHAELVRDQHDSEVLLSQVS